MTLIMFDALPENSNLYVCLCVYIYIYVCVYLFGLVSLFNGISTLFRLFNAKAILLEEQ